jgi:hypothetical protein
LEQLELKEKQQAKEAKGQTDEAPIDEAFKKVKK